MSVYRFDSHSPVDEVTVERSDGGGARGYLHAAEICEPACMERLKRKLEKEDLQWTPLWREGKPVLEVRGFGRKDENLLSILKEVGAISGPYTRKPLVSDLVGTTEKLNKRKLQASGLSYFIGDMSFMKYGYSEAFEGGKLVAPQDLLAGIFYALGSWFIALFGKGDKSDVQLRDLARTTLKEFKVKGVALPGKSSLHAAAESYNDGWFKKTIDFCEKFPSELTNGTFGLGGSMILWGSIRRLFALHRNPALVNDGGHSKGATILDIGLGAMTLMAGLISVFVKEEKIDPEEEKQHPKKGLARLWQKIKEKPLRIAGGALMISTLCHAGSTTWDLINTKKNLGSAFPAVRKRAQELKDNLFFRGVFVGSNLVAEGLMSTASKGHGSGVKTDTSLDRSAYAVMADLVLRSPEEQRESMLSMAAKILARKEHIGGDIPSIEEKIRAEMALMEKNPWNGAVEKPVIVTEAVHEEKDSNWRDRVNTPVLSQLSPVFS